MSNEILTRWLTLEDLEARTISYSQNHEDVLLQRVFGKNFSGFYVDVGANDPVFHSVTKLLYVNGWRGINIEPTPALHERLKEDRPLDLNLHMGISDTAATLTFYEVAPPLHGWSTFMPEMAASYHAQGVATVEKPIMVDTLNNVFETHVKQHVDVLKIDVEGLERQVLSTFDFRKWRPRVVLVEATWRDLWEGYILQSDYLLAAFDGINRYYVRPEDRQLLEQFEAPVNLLDNFVDHEVLRLIKSTQPSSVAPDNHDLDSLVGPSTAKVIRLLKKTSKRFPRSGFMARRIFGRLKS